MAKISAKNIELKDSEKIIFGTGDNSFIEWDELGNQLEVSTVVSGVLPTQPAHLTTKYYVDQLGTTISGDITQEVSDNYIDNYEMTTISNTLQSGIDYYSHHGNLMDLNNDDHPHYILVDGTRAFTSTVSGVYPTEDDHLITKKYLVDTLTGGTTVSGEELTSFSNFDYVLSLTESQTTSTAFVNKTNLTVSGLAYGRYRLGNTFEWRLSKTNETFYVQITLDDTDIVYSFESSPYVSTLFWNPVSQFFYRVLSSGTHSFDFDFRTSNASTTASVKNVRFEFWRIL